MRRCVLLIALLAGSISHTAMADETHIKRTKLVANTDTGVNLQVVEEKLGLSKNTVETKREPNTYMSVSTTEEVIQQSTPIVPVAPTQTMCGNPPLDLSSIQPAAGGEPVQIAPTIAPLDLSLANAPLTEAEENARSEK